MAIPKFKKGDIIEAIKYIDENGVNTRVFTFFKKQRSKNTDIDY